MKNLTVLLLLLAGCTAMNEPSVDQISLDGEWRFAIDTTDIGVKEKWYEKSFDETVMLPGSMALNGKGFDVTVNTRWVGDVIDKSYFTSEKYSKYREPGNIKIPFWLKPEKYYRGVAWYQRDIDLPENWGGKRITASFERCHWETTLFVNGVNAGSENSLAVPHTYDITSLVHQGKNTLTMRVNNEIIIPVGVNSHSISDHTQSNWNGIAGEMTLTATPLAYIDNVKIYPDIDKKVAKVVVRIINESGAEFKGKLSFRVESTNSKKKQKLGVKNVTIVTNEREHEVVMNYKILRPLLWSEFNPALYNLLLELEDNGKEVIDNTTEVFGMREFATEGTRFTINGNPVFLRGTTECCIFPLTGYPPTDYASWERILNICKDYGLNHMRFHSYCPPEAAFEAADRLGIYFHIECSSWANQGSSIGNGGETDTFIYNESEKILREYGNHPSFCMLAYGNEPAGRNQNAFLGKLIEHWRVTDGKRLYTSAAGWPVITESDYHLISAPRIQQWGDGLKSIINREPVNTMFDFAEIISKYQVPVISHEIGQWCVYPDLDEIKDYTGVLKASNFEIFKETLEANNMGDQAHDFLMASGKLQALCYKADIEAALRTPGFAGFELLQLHDFPGQGTALVGILNPFFESKGYISPSEFRMFCNETVPLARISKMTYTQGDLFSAGVEISHAGKMPLKDVVVACRIRETEGRIINEQKFLADEIPVGNCGEVGTYRFDLNGIKAPMKYIFEVAIEGTDYINSWDFWVYPAEQSQSPGEVYITERLDQQALEHLGGGGKVLLLTYGSVQNGKGAEVAIGYSSIFWNTAWTRNQAPHTLGILCDPQHPVFSDFPTEFHTNYQWWDPVTHSQAMIINDFPGGMRPLIQPIDTWFENRRLALAFEAVCSGGKLLVCSIDLKDPAPERIVSRQLLKSILGYMNSPGFNPVTEIKPVMVTGLLNFTRD